MRLDAVRVGLATLVVATLSTTATAQPPSPPLLTAGVGIAVNCPGANDGIPVLPCTRWGEATPGLHPRALIDVRPYDRLLVSLTVGALRVRGSTYEATGPTPAETWSISRSGRTSWHVATTVAYVGGAPSHAVRGFIGGGLLAYRDPVVVSITGNTPPPAWLDGVVARSGIGTVLTAGALVRGGRRWNGKLTYLLASEMADANRSDGGWRHELSLGVGWHVRGR
jgi:hypothetical protein